MEFSRIPQFPNPSADFAVIWPACAHVADADFAFYVGLLSDGRFAGAGANGILGSTVARNSDVSRLGNFLVSRRFQTPPRILL